MGLGEAADVDHLVRDPLDQADRRGGGDRAGRVVLNTYSAAMTQRISHWSDGRRTPGTSGRMAPVYDPTKGRRSAEVELASSREVGVAVAKAVVAAKEWRHASLSQRSGVLFAFRQLLHERTDELAAIITAGHGKVLSDAAGEIARGLDNSGTRTCTVPRV